MSQLGHRSRLVGVLPLLAFAVLTAAVDVYAGNRLQTLSPLAVAAFSFTLAAVFFVASDARQVLGSLRTHRGDVIAISVTTAVTWLSLLYALKYLEPAVVNVVGLALGPVFTVLLSPLLRRGTSVLPAEFGVSFGIVVVIGVLVWGSVTGRSGIGDRPLGEVVVGVALTIVCALAGTGNVLYSKRLSESGHGPRSVLAVRFFLIVAVSWVLVSTSANPGLGSAFLPAVLIAAMGVALPLYLFQVGVKHTEPITASLLATLSPLFALLLQLPDPRLRPSNLSLACVAGITALVAAGVVIRLRPVQRQEGSHISACQ